MKHLDGHSTAVQLLDARDGGQLERVYKCQEAPEEHSALIRWIHS